MVTPNGRDDDEQLASCVRCRSGIARCSNGGDERAGRGCGRAARRARPGRPRGRPWRRRAAVRQRRRRARRRDRARSRRAAPGVRRTRRTPPRTLADVGRTPHPPRPPRVERQRRNERDERERRRDCVDELGMDREQEAAERGADDHRRLEDDRSLGERAARGSRVGTSDGVRARPAGAARAAATPVPNASTKNGHVWLGSAVRDGEEPEGDERRRARLLRRAACGAGTGRRCALPEARAAAAGRTSPGRRGRGRAGCRAPRTPASRWRRTTSRSQAPSRRSSRRRARSRGAGAGSSLDPRLRLLPGRRPPRRERRGTRPRCGGSASRSTSSTVKRRPSASHLVAHLGGTAEQAEHEARRGCGTPSCSSPRPNCSLKSSIGNVPSTRIVASSIALDRLVGQVELVLDLADDLLEQVLERDDARRRAVLVDDDGHVLVRACGTRRGALRGPWSRERRSQAAGARRARPRRCPGR